MAVEYTLFDTAVGRCGLAWTPRGIIAVQLPEESDARTIERLGGEHDLTPSNRPPAFVLEAIDRLGRHLGGEVVDLASVPVVFGPMQPFRKRIYEELRKVEAGRTVTYGELASAAGSPGAARAVGQAMAKNRLPLLVPCHRVLGAGGTLHGFSAAGGLSTKAKLLALEGVRVAAPKRQAGSAPFPFDPRQATAFLSRADAKLAALIDSVGPFALELEPLGEPYEALANAIVYQQLNPKAAQTIAGRVKAIFGRDRYPTPEQILGTADDPFRAAGLSRGKLAAFRDLAHKALGGRLPRRDALDRMSDEAIIEALSAVRGIGAWTVQMVLIFRLGRPDVLPLDDYGLRRGFGKWFLRGRLATKDEVLRRGERWRPFRSVASWYLWRANER